VAGTVDIYISVVAPAIAVILEDVPSRDIGVEPSLIPAWIVDISCIICNQRSRGIPLIKPDVSLSRNLHP